MKHWFYLPLVLLLLTFWAIWGCSDSEDCPTCSEPEAVPNEIDNLTAGPAGFNSLVIMWSAPDSALEYDIRYSTAMIDTSNWASATQIADEPTPGDKGDVEYLKINNLETGTTYYFAIKFRTDSTTWSDLSNVADGFTSTFDARNKIAYASDVDGDYELFIMDSDGSNKTQITHNFYTEIQPAWTSNGSSLVYITIVTDTNEIAIIDILTGESANLTNNSIRELRPSVSHTNNMIAYMSLALHDHEWDIFKSNIDGSGAVFLTNCDTCTDYYPAWSNDGTKIVFTRIINFYDFSICTIDQFGSNLTEIYSGAFGDGFSFSPDDSKIAFGKDNVGITVIDADGSNPVDYTVPSESGASYPSWSPDGTKIAFTAFDGNDYEIYVMNADGTNIIQLTDNDSNDMYPAWSPFY